MSTLPNHKRKIIASLLPLLLAISIGPSARAQSLRETTSLGFAPADSSFYVSMLRGREQYERMVNTKAFAKLRALPFVQQVIAKAKEEWYANDDLSELRGLLDQSVNQELVSLLCDGVSDEVFIIGDNSVAMWISAMNRISNASNMAQLNALQTGQDPQELVRAEIIKMINETPEMLKAPETIIGLRIADRKRVEAQVSRLEATLKALLEAEAPELVDRLSREKIGDSAFLTMQLDGSLVPWADVFADADVEGEDAAALLEKLNQVKVTISLGSWREYVLFAISEDTAMIKALGTGDLLADKREMAPLAYARDKKITGISYVDGSFLRRMSAVDQQIDQMTTVIKAVMPIVPIDLDLKDEIAKDAEQFGQELKAMIPEMGSISSYSIMTDTGAESFSFNWGEQPTVDGSKPLTILNHVGGSPIAFAAGRGKPNPAAGQFARKWSAKLAGYVERIAVPFLDAEQSELYEQVKQEMLPLLAKIDKANREKLSVAFADGQSAIVLDARLKSTSWVAAIPPSDTELPLPELCVVSGVSDAKLLKEGYAEWFEAIQTAITKLNEIAPEQVPPIQIPPPQREQTDAGTVYYYPTPPLGGVDERIAANAGVSEDTMVLSLVPEATKRLLAEHPLDLGHTLATTDRPLAAAWQFNTAAFVEMLRPWVNYGFATAAAEGAVDEDVQEQVNTVLDVLSCLRSSSGISYFKDDVLISHQMTQVKDIE